MPRAVSCRASVLSVYATRACLRATTRLPFTFHIAATRLISPRRHAAVYAMPFVVAADAMLRHAAAAAIAVATPRLLVCHYMSRYCRGWRR